MWIYFVLIICLMLLLKLRKESFTNDTRTIIITSKEYPLEYVKSLQKLNPECSIDYYNDYECDQFVQIHFESKVYNAYKNLKPTSYKADLFRYCVLYIKGGIYTDAGVDYNTSFAKMYPSTKNTLYTVQDISQGSNENIGGIQIALMCVNCKKHPFFMECINKVVENVENKYYGETPLAITGPGLAYKVFSNYKNNQYPIKLIANLKRETHQSCGNEYDATITVGNDVISCWKPKMYYKAHKSRLTANYARMWQTRDVYHR